MGGKHSTSSSKVSVPPEVLARYNAINTRAEGVAATPFERYGNQASDFVAQMNAQQNAGISDINATAGSYRPYMSAANDATMAGMGPAYQGINNYMSPYIKNVADTTGAMMRQQFEQAQSGNLGNAISSGAFGGDRAGIAAANLQQQNQMGYGKTMADIYNQGYTQALGASQADLARQMQGGSQLAALGAQEQQLGLQGAQAKIAAGTMQQQTEQAGKDAMIKQFMQEKGYPFQVAQFLANIAMGTGAASGSTTTATQPIGFFGNLATGGRVGGYADGGGVAGPKGDSQSPIWGEGYVPSADLPVRQLMVADPPEQQQSSGLGDIVKLIAASQGAKRGGVIEGRHGYYDGGDVADGPSFERYGREHGTASLADMANTISDQNTGVSPRQMDMRDDAKARSLSALRAAEDKSGPAADYAMAAGLNPGGASMLPPQPADVPQSAGLVPPERPATLGLRPVGPTPTQQSGRGIPLLTQADYGMSEPEFKSYTSHNYATPADAAVGANTYYEKAGEGVGDNAAISNANRVYAAIQNGGDGLTPNELALYNHYKEKGWNDDVQIAGMIGRFNVEAGDGINPNARNTIGGGSGTYGIMQARGPRFEGLAAAGGMTPEQLAGMPTTNGGVSGGGNTPYVSMSTSGQPSPASLGDDPFHINKPYEERNAIGKFFHDKETGKLDKNAVLSLLSGLGTMASSRSISPITAMLQGLGGGAEMYKGLQTQEADIASKNIENMRKIQMDTALYNEQYGTNLTPSEYAKSVGANFEVPQGAGTGTNAQTGKLGMHEYQTGTVNIGGNTVRMQDDPASLQRFISDNGMFPPGTPIGDQVQEARSHLAAINASGGMTVDAAGRQIQVPGYTDVGNVQAKSEADRLASAKFREEAGPVMEGATRMLAATNQLKHVYENMEPGKLAGTGAAAAGYMAAIDPDNVFGWKDYDLTDPAQYEIAMKGMGEVMASRLSTLPGGAPAAEIDFLRTFTPGPDMQGPAVKKLLAITEAEARYKMDLYNSYDPAIHGNDINAYERKFNDNGKTFQKYVDDSYKNMPKFKNEPMSAEEIAAEAKRRGFVQDANGNWSKP